MLLRPKRSSEGKHRRSATAKPYRIAKEKTYERRDNFCDRGCKPARTKLPFRAWGERKCAAQSRQRAARRVARGHTQRISRFLDAELYAGRARAMSSWQSVTFIAWPTQRAKPGEEIECPGVRNLQAAGLGFLIWFRWSFSFE